MVLPIRLVGLVCCLVLAATTCKAQQDYPICFACGCETCEVGYPRGVIHLPANLQGSLGNLETITCFQFNQAGIGGLLPAPICALNRLESFRSTCECPRGGGIVVQNESEPTATSTELPTGTPTSIPVSFDVIAPTDAPSQAPQPTDTPISSDVTDPPSQAPQLRRRTSERPSAAPHTTSPSVNSKKRDDTVKTSTNKKSSKKDHQAFSGKPSNSDTAKPIELNGKGARTESQHESTKPKSSSGRPKKDRTEKKTKLKLVKSQVNGQLGNAYG